MFRYFLEWLKLEIAPKHYVQWLDNHIYAYFAVGMIVFLLSSHSHQSMLQRFPNCSCLILGSPLLGATEAVKATFSGVLFGLPIAEVLPF